MKYFFLIILLFTSCISTKIKNKPNLNSTQSVPVELVDINNDGNISTNEIVNFKSIDNLNQPFQIFIVLVISVLLISVFPYILIFIKNKNVFKNKQAK